MTHFSLSGVGGTLAPGSSAWEEPGVTQAQRRTRTQKKSGEKELSALNTGDQTGKQTQLCTFVGCLGYSRDCRQVDRQLLLPTQAVLICVYPKIIKEWI